MIESSRPRVSLILLAFNQQETVRRAAESCLAQQGEPLEIVLSDDASSDGTFGILQQVAASYCGPHRVIARRNERNLGIGEHYNRLLSCTSGDLLVTAAGDDLSVPHRTERLISAWDDSGGRADLVASHAVDLDGDGALHDRIRVDDLSGYRGAIDWARRRPYVIGATHAFTRRMMQRFGPLARNVCYEDEIMAFRAIVGGGAVTVDEALVHYRRGGTSRRPGDFESPEHLRRWSERQRDRELAVIDQLVADAARVGCEQLVLGRFDSRMRRERYLRDLRVATTRRERWSAFQSDVRLPFWWRLRKMLHVMYPAGSSLVREHLALGHRRRQREYLSRRSG